MEKESRKVCSTCGGTGEIGYFQGESRFLLTRDECPHCCGLGYLIDDDADEREEEPGNAPSE